jgi:hypothetical protein
MAFSKKKGLSLRYSFLFFARSRKIQSVDLSMKGEKGVLMFCMLSTQVALMSTNVNATSTIFCWSVQSSLLKLKLL